MKRTRDLVEMRQSPTYVDAALRDVLRWSNETWDSELNDHRVDDLLRQTYSEMPRLVRERLLSSGRKRR